MPVSGNRLEFPERSWDTWSQHRLLGAKEVGTYLELRDVLRGCCMGSGG